jgi:hypothetical protein
MAHPETREYMMKIIRAVEKVDPIVTIYCVPNCVYRWRCPEAKPCGFFNSPNGISMRTAYDSVCSVR